MEGDNMKIVHFDEYCPTCKHEGKSSEDEPCTYCLDVPAREYSHKPEKWEEK